MMQWQQELRSKRGEATGTTTEWVTPEEINQEITQINSVKKLRA